MVDNRDYIIGHTLIIKGRISNVRFVEQAPWNARKVKSAASGGRTFPAYAVDFGTSAEETQRYRQLLVELEDMGVWTEAIARYDEAAMARAERAEQAMLDAEPLHPAWEGLAAHLCSKGQQVEKLLDKIGRRTGGPDAQEVQRLFWVINNHAQPVQATEAWAAGRERLRALNEKY
jgi:hypothetical protein